MNTRIEIDVEQVQRENAVLAEQLELLMALQAFWLGNYDEA